MIKDYHKMVKLDYQLETNCIQYGPLTTRYIEIKLTIYFRQCGNILVQESKTIIPYLLKDIYFL